MATTNDDLSVRIDRLERDVRRLASGGAGNRREDLVNQLSFLGWLKISGPTFAVMVFGFGLLWQSQQALSAQMLEMSRSMGRLEDAITGLDQRTGRLETAITGLQTQMAQLGAAIDKLSARVDRLETR